MLEETKIRITTSSGDIIIDDFDCNDCVNCILNSCNNTGSAFISCPKDKETKKRLFAKQCNNALVLICDNKEKNRTNFIQMAELICHNVKMMCTLHDRIRQEEIQRIDLEISVFKHNIETINGESIREFEATIPMKKLRHSYKDIVKTVEDTIHNRSNSIPSFVAKQALNNQRIQTEILVSRIIGNRYDSKSTFSNPWDAVITNVYVLYPLAQKKKIEINLGYYQNKFQIDYNATKVASYYILDNAVKYANVNTSINVEFVEKETTLNISFLMLSPLIKKEEAPLIFDKGYRGSNVRNLQTSGYGYGLYCAKQLLEYAHASIIVLPGEFECNVNGVDYANNEFRIILPTKMPKW